MYQNPYRNISRLVLVSAAMLLLLCAATLDSAVAGPIDAYVFPVMSPRLSSNYGKRVHPLLGYSRMHQGVDLAAPNDSPIRAVAKGVVVFADPYKGYGNLVVVMHGEGLSTHYGHCKALKVQVGQRITAGEIIATVGSTGHSTGPHLHFEIRLRGEPQRPSKYISSIAGPGEG
ncbi:M23 family metallopeptidase [Oligoflexia bacterium]|nr:M23 family metallopeptidase [Oligoflexia bacterium]